MHRVEYIEHERHFKEHAASAIGRWKKWAVQSKEARTSLEVAEDHFARYQLALSVKMLHEHAEWTHAIRRAGRWFLHMETMTRLRRWKLYVQYRREKNAAREEAHEFWREKASRQVLALLKEGVETRRIILMARRWMTGNLIGRCFGLWCEYFDECRYETEAMEKAVNAYTKRTLENCWASWTEHHALEVEEGQNNEIAEEHWKMSVYRTFFEGLHMCGKDELAQRHYESLVLNSAYTSWVAYLHMRIHKHESMDRAEDHWRHSNLRSHLKYLSSFTEYQRIIRKGLMFFTHGLHLRIIQNWRDFVEEEKCSRKAVAWFLRLILRRMLFRWNVFVDMEFEKHERKEKGDSFYKDGLRRRYMAGWRDRYRGRRDWHAGLGGAVAAFTRKLRRKREAGVLNGWRGYKDGRADKTALKKKADKYYQSNILRASLELFHTWATERKENQAILKRFGMWFTDLTRKRIFAGWTMYVDMRREKKALVKRGEEYFLRTVVTRWKGGTEAKKESMAIIRRAAIWLTNALSKRMIIAWVAFVEMCRELRAETERNVQLLYLRRLRKRARARIESRSKLDGFGKWHLKSAARRTMKEWRALHVYRRQRASVQRAAAGRAVALWSRRNLGVAIARFVGTAVAGAKKRGAVAHFRAALLQRTLGLWIEDVEDCNRQSEMLGAAQGHYDQALRGRAWGRWCDYVASRFAKAEGRAEADAHRGRQQLAGALRRLSAHVGAHRALYASEDFHLQRGAVGALARWSRWAPEQRNRAELPALLPLKLAMLELERFQVAKWTTKRQLEIAERHASTTRKREVFSVWIACRGRLGSESDDAPASVASASGD